MPPADRCSVASSGMQCLVGLAEFLPEHLTSHLERKLTVLPSDYVHRVINEPDITILAKLLLHPI